MCSATLKQFHKLKYTHHTCACERVYAYLEGHLIFGHIAQDNEAFFLCLSRTKAKLLCRARRREKTHTVKQSYIGKGSGWRKTEAEILKI